MSKHYRIKWEIDIENEEDITTAVLKAQTYMQLYMTVSVYEVENKKTGEKWEVDCAENPYEVTQIENGMHQ